MSDTVEFWHQQCGELLCLIEDLRELDRDVFDGPGTEKIEEIDKLWKAGVDRWKTVPAEATAELLADTTKGKQVLAYENGRYYNAWLEFEQPEGGWLWMDDGDSDPNPSHYMPLPAPPSQETSHED